MSFLPAILIAAGTTIAVIGKVREGQMMSEAAKYNAAVAQAEAEAIKTSSEFETQTLQEQSKVEQYKLQQEKKSAVSTQQALYAKAGVRVFEGTPLDVMATTAAQYELDLATNRYNLQTGLQKIRYETDVGVARASSQVGYYGSMSKYYKQAGYMGAGSTLLTGAGQVGAVWPKDKD